MSWTKEQAIHYAGVSKDLRKNGKVFIVSCGPDLRKVTVLAHTAEQAFVKALKKANPKTLNMFATVKKKGKPGLWFLTEQVLRDQGLLEVGA